MNPAPADDRAIGLSTQALLDSLGLGQLVTLEPVAGGANNRGFIASTSTQRCFVKSYFRDPGDLRDRLKAEYSFSRFAWDHGVRCIPQPLAQDPHAGLALYSFVAGRRLQPVEVSHVHVTQALAFWKELNVARSSTQARELAAGSEACFSVHDHLHCVDRRLQRLQSIEADSPVNIAAKEFVAQHLQPTWTRATQACQQKVTALGFSLEAQLQSRERCLSPSDFGFHNALLDDAGKLTFLDFEYAGWDDPAKLACDFFCQPQVPVPAKLFDGFSAALMQVLHLPDAHVHRARALLAVYRIKWCCIMLNEFQPVGARRRRFALSEVELEARKRAQLERVRDYLGLIEIE